VKSIEIGCSKCGSEDFQLLDPKTGEMLCKYCRNRWVEPSLIQKTETEIEPVKHYHVIVDNNAEANRQFNERTSKIASFVVGGCMPIVLIFTAIVLIFLFGLVVSMNLVWGQGY